MSFFYCRFLIFFLFTFRFGHSIIYAQELIASWTPKNKVFFVYHPKENLVEALSENGAQLLNFYLFPENIKIESIIPNPVKKQSILLGKSKTQKTFLFLWEWDIGVISLKREFKIEPHILSYSKSGNYIIISHFEKQMSSIELLNANTAQSQYNLTNISRLTDFVYLGVSDKNLMVYNSLGSLEYYNIVKGHLVATVGTEEKLNVIGVLPSSNNISLLAQNENDILIINRLTGYVEDYKKSYEKNQYYFYNNSFISLQATPSKITLIDQTFNQTKLEFKQHHILQLSLLPDTEKFVIGFKDGILVYDQTEKGYYFYNQEHFKGIRLIPQFVTYPAQRGLYPL